MCRGQHACARMHALRRRQAKRQHHRSHRRPRSPPQPCGRLRQVVCDIPVHRDARRPQAIERINEESQPFVRKNTPKEQHPQTRADFRATRSDHNQGQDGTARRSLSSIGLVYQVTGRFAEADKVLSRSLAMREQLLGPDHPDVANSLNNLGHGYWLEGRYTEAEAAHLRALAIREKTFGPNHPSVAESLLNLGNVYL